MSDGSILQSVVQYVVSEIVLNPEQVKVSLVEGDEPDEVIAEVFTAKSDIGRVIGRNGRVARNIRVIAQAAGDEEGISTRVEFVE